MQAFSFIVYFAKNFANLRSFKLLVMIHRSNYTRKIWKKNNQGANQANWRGTIQDSDSAAISAPGHRRLTGDNWYHLPCKYRVSSLAEPVGGKRARARRIAERNRRWDNYVLVLEKGEAPVNSTLRGPRKKPPAATSSCVKIRRRAHCVRILALNWSKSRSRI